MYITNNQNTVSINHSNTMNHNIMVSFCIPLHPDLQVFAVQTVNNGTICSNDRGMLSLDSVFFAQDMVNLVGTGFTTVE